MPTAGPAAATRGPTGRSGAPRTAGRAPAGRPADQDGDDPVERRAGQAQQQRRADRRAGADPQRQPRQQGPLTAQLPRIPYARRCSRGCAQAVRDVRRQRRQAGAEQRGEGEQRAAPAMVLTVPATRPAPASSSASAGLTCERTGRAPCGHPAPGGPALTAAGRPVTVCGDEEPVCTRRNSDDESDCEHGPAGATIRRARPRERGRQSWTGHGCAPGWACDGRRCDRALARRGRSLRPPGQPVLAVRDLWKVFGPGAARVPATRRCARSAAVSCSSGTAAPPRCATCPSTSRPARSSSSWGCPARASPPWSAA